MKTVPPYCVENWIEMKRGDTLQFDALWAQGNGDPVDLTGYTAKMQVRPQTENGAPVLDLSTGGSGITLGGASGTILVTAPAATTRAIAPGEYVYDLELTSPTGVVTTIVAGTFTLFADVTRPA